MFHTNCPRVAAARVAAALLSIGLIAGSAAHPISAAEKPTIDRLFPPGGQRGTTVKVTLTGKPGDELLQVWSDRNELQVQVAEDRKTAEITIPDDATPGLHRLRFWNAAGCTDLLPFLVGTIEEHAEAEPNDLPTDTQPLPSPSVLINGVLARAGDVDVYQVAGKAGQTLVASVTANEQLGSPMDAVLQVLDSSGTVLAQNDDDHNFDPQLAVPLKYDGPVFVRIFAFPATPNSTIRFSGAASYVYRLTLTTEGFIDHALPLCVPQGQETVVHLHGWNLQETQQVVTVPTDSPSQTVLTGNASNSITLARTDHTVQVEPPDGSAVTVEVPSVYCGCISEAAQQDTIFFVGKKGQKLRVQVDARRFYSLLDPVVTIRGPDESPLKVADDVSRENLDAATDVTLKSDGQHSISITDRYASGSPRHFYAVQLTEPQPSFTATANQNAFTFSEDANTPVELQIERSGGLAESIAFTVTGLPDGVDAEPAVSEKEGDSAKKVTLTLQRSETMASGFSGPIEIVGRIADGPGQPVTAPIANSSDTTSVLWLTVPPRPDQPAGKADSTAEAKPEPAAP